MKKTKKDGAFMKICVIAIFIIVTVYTFIHLFLSFAVGVEVAPVASGAFYAFFAGEAGILSYIKHMKKKAERNDERGAEIDGEDTGNDFNDDHSISD